MMPIIPDFSKYAKLDPNAPRLISNIPSSVERIQRGIKIHRSGNSWSHGATVPITLNGNACYLDRKSCCNFLGIDKKDVRPAAELAQAVFDTFWQAPPPLPMRNFSMDIIPSEIIKMFLGSVNISKKEIKTYLVNCSLVNKAWNSAIKLAKNTILQNNISDLSEVSQGQLVDYLKLNAGKLFDLNLSRHPSLKSDETADILKLFPNLQTLKIFNFQKTVDSLLLEIGKLNNLSSLDLSSCKVTDAGINHLNTLTNLTSLNLSGCNITDACLPTLATLTNLTSLNLSNCNITDACLPTLATLTNLTSLNLSGCSITSNGLDQLQTLTNLSSLTLDNSRLGVNRLDFLTNHTNLTSFNFSDNNGLQIRTDELIHITKLINLTFLSLKGCAFIRDTWLGHLTTLTNLTGLELENFDSIKDAGFAHLSSFTNLTYLNLTSNRITDIGVAHLKALTKLTSLNLCNCKNLSNVSAAHLKRLPNLQSLDHRNSSITSQGIATLKSSPGQNLAILGREFLG